LISDLQTKRIPTDFNYSGSWTNSEPLSIKQPFAVAIPPIIKEAMKAKRVLYNKTRQSKAVGEGYE
jgi:hypothetical protein